MFQFLMSTSSSEESSCQPNLKWLLAHIDEPREVICQLSSLNEHFQHPHCFMILMRTLHSDYSISKVEETLRHYLSPLLKTFPRSLFVVNIIKSHLERPFFTIPTRAVLQSLVRSSDKNSDGAMDLEEFESFGDFNLVYTHWPQQLEMAKSSLWGLKRLATLPA